MEIPFAEIVRARLFGVEMGLLSAKSLVTTEIRFRVMGVEAIANRLSGCRRFLSVEMPMHSRPQLNRAASLETELEISTLLSQMLIEFSEWMSPGL